MSPVEGVGAWIRPAAAAASGALAGAAITNSGSSPIQSISGFGVTILLPGTVGGSDPEGFVSGNDSLIVPVGLAGIYLVAATVQLTGSSGQPTSGHAKVGTWGTGGGGNVIADVYGGYGAWGQAGGSTWRWTASFTAFVWLDEGEEVGLECGEDLNTTTGVNVNPFPAVLGIWLFRSVADPGT